MKRITSLDFFRGIAVFMMTVVHVLFAWEDMQARDLTTYPVGMIILGGVIVVFSHWRGFFLMISAVGHTYQENESIKKGKKRSSIFWNQILAGVILVVLGKFWLPFFPLWGMIDAWTHMGGWVWDVWTMFYLAETLDTLGLMIIITAFISLLFSIKKLHIGWQLQVWIYSILGLVIIIVSPYVQDAIISVAGIDITIGENFRDFGYAFDRGIWEKIVRVPLNWIAGREAPLFPMLGSFFVGNAIAIIISQKEPKKRHLWYLFIPAVLCIIAGALDFIFLEKLALDIGFHVHPRWFALVSIGLQSMVLIGFIILIEFNPRINQQRWLKGTRFIRRFGIFALTVFFLQTIEAIPRLLYGLIFRQFDWGHRYMLDGPHTLLLLVTVMLMWVGLLYLWDRVFHGYGSWEWFVRVVIQRKGSKNPQDPLNLDGSLYNVEMVTFWQKPIEETPIPPTN